MDHEFFVTRAPWQEDGAGHDRTRAAIMAHIARQFDADDREAQAINLWPDMVAMLEQLIAMQNCGVDMGVLNHHMSSDTRLEQIRELLRRINPESGVLKTEPRKLGPWKGGA